MRLAQQIALLLVFLGAWQASALALPAIYLSTPVAVASSFAVHVGNGNIPAAFVASLWQVAAGYVIGVALGIGVGVLIGRSSLAEHALDPFVSFGNATPSIATLPLLIVWFGVSGIGRIAFITVVTIWPTLVNTIVGLKSVPDSYEKIGRAFGLSRRQRLLGVSMNAAAPNILAGMRLSLAHALVAMVISGQEIGENGLGGLAEKFATYFETGDLIGVVVSTTLLALLCFWALRRLQSRIFPWIEETSV